MLKPAELGSVEKLAILILSDTNGATTREVKRPVKKGVTERDRATH